MQSPADVSRLSVFTPMGYQRNKCGYCKKKSGSASYYAQAAELRADHYQELVDRGWRRSGRLLYKQDLTRSCCPHYTIRLDASSYKPRKDQRQALHRWNRYVLGQEYIQKAARLCPKTKNEKRRRKNRFDLLTAVHESEYANLKRLKDPKTGKPIEPAHKFEVTLESDSFSQRKFDVFLPYQMTVHREPASRWNKSSFTRFLCSGVDRKTVRQDDKEQKIGSYHQCYRLDGRLIAVGVIDLLPHAVSAVYLYYDPEFHDWEFGKLSALREIALAIEGAHRYYYMGFYIHSCIKMRYKAAYAPQFILDPESLTWDPLDNEMLKELDKHPYVSLSRQRRSGPTAPPNSDAAQLENVEEHKTNDTSTLQAPTSAKDNGNAAEGSESEEETEIPEGSLFDMNIPGVLTAEEVENQIDLDRMLLLANGSFVEMEDLVGWENSTITQPQAIKGIVAELAATLGPQVAKECAVVLF